MTLDIEKLSPWAHGWETLALREPQTVTGVIVHRIEVSQEDASFGDTPQEVVRFFREHPIGVKATGGAMPYPILIQADGSICQTLPLSRVSPHAVSQNLSSVGVACIGDFREQEVPQAQWQALVAVCAALVKQLGQTSAAIHAHDELPGASRDPDKECPGRRLDMHRLRDTVGDLLADASEQLFAW